MRTRQPREIEAGRGDAKLGIPSLLPLANFVLEAKCSVVGAKIWAIDRSSVIAYSGAALAFLAMLGMMGLIRE